MYFCIYNLRHRREITLLTQRSFLPKFLEKEKIIEGKRKRESVTSTIKARSREQYITVTTRHVQIISRMTNFDNLCEPPLIIKFIRIERTFYTLLWCFFLFFLLSLYLLLPASCVCSVLKRQENCFYLLCRKSVPTSPQKRKDSTLPPPIVRRNVRASIESAYSISIFRWCYG